MAPGQPTTLAWNVTGASSITLDHGIGFVTNQTSLTLVPSQNTIYTLIATNSIGTAMSRINVWISPLADGQAPTAPAGLSGSAQSTGGVKLMWSASTDNVGVFGYQVLRNGAVIASVTGLSYSDVTTSPSTTYTYQVKAYDASGNVSPASNSVQVTTSSVSLAPTCAPISGAFTGCYYNNLTLTGTPALIRVDSAINFNWAWTSPAPSIGTHGYSVRWQGNFTFAQGSYTFKAVTSDGMRLYIDGQMVLDRWVDQPPYQYAVHQTLSQGNHLVVVEYYEDTGASEAQVSWTQN